MQAAKAKAAAKQAALKKKQAAAAAAAAAELAAKQAAAASAVPPPSATMATRNRPSVTQYWADSASSQLGPGGGIQRIGFDQALFEAAYREIVLENNKAEWPAFKSPLEEDAEAEAEVEEGKQEGEGDKAPEAEQETKAEEGQDGKVQVNKDDIALIVRELEIERSEAEAALRKATGDVALALKNLVTAPVTL